MSIRSDVALCRACGRVDLKENLVAAPGAPAAFDCPACAGAAR